MKSKLPAGSTEAFKTIPALRKKGHELKQKLVSPDGLF